MTKVHTSYGGDIKWLCTTERAGVPSNPLNVAEHYCTPPRASGNGERDCWSHEPSGIAPWDGSEVRGEKVKVKIYGCE